MFRLIFEDESGTNSHSIAEQTRLIVLNALNNTVQVPKNDADVLGESRNDAIL